MCGKATCLCFATRRLAQKEQTLVLSRTLHVKVRIMSKTEYVWRKRRMMLSDARVAKFTAVGTQDVFAVHINGRTERIQHDQQRLLDLCIVQSLIVSMAQLRHEPVIHILLDCAHGM